MSKTTNTIEMKTIKMLILTELLTEHTGKQHLRQFHKARIFSTFRQNEPHKPSFPYPIQYLKYI
jgi:hypothetical protein